MVTFIWFTDNKLLKFYYCNHKKAQNNHFHALVGIAFDFYIFQHDSAPAHTACEMVEFLACETLDFVPPCCLVLIRFTFFISEPEKVHYQSRVATDSTS